MGANIDRIRSYYEALNSGDAARVASHCQGNLLGFDHAGRGHRTLEA